MALTRALPPPALLQEPSLSASSGVRGIPQDRPTPPRDDIGGPDDLAVTLAVILGAVVVAVIIIPLLLFGIELILLGLLVAAGIVGRGLLGRPWIVQARRVSETAPAFSWQVSGWRRSAQMIDEVTAALSAGLDPSRSQAQETFTSTP